MHVEFFVNFFNCFKKSEFQKENTNAYFYRLYFKHYNSQLLELLHLGLGSVDDVGLKRVSSRNGRLLGLLGYWRLNLSLLNAPCNNFFRVMTAPADFFESPLMMDRVASGDLILNDIDVSERTRDVCHACIPHKG